MLRVHSRNRGTYKTRDGKKSWALRHCSDVSRRTSNSLALQLRKTNLRGDPMGRHSPEDGSSIGVCQSCPDRDHVHLRNDNCSLDRVQAKSFTPSNPNLIVRRQLRLVAQSTSPA